ncbi:Uncharacterised protein [Afipia felis]|uniref:Uncharacterized protein n=3 Tax=Afipia felis TaxID=1035 RepID=A0A380WC02_AFIFE|nr:hypothetical protein HMPREF9697_02237 [Afipia felis ATCC 53690]SUU78416.1 Uncharacterised protein [Afipia felis]SUU86481.1 Uncharacterised protein [Afipia felis]
MISEGVSIPEIEEVAGFACGEDCGIEFKFLLDDIAKPPLDLINLLPGGCNLAGAAIEFYLLQCSFGSNIRKESAAK